MVVCTGDMTASIGMNMGMDKILMVTVKLAYIVCYDVYRSR